jgi:hypothetical protein
MVKANIGNETFSKILHNAAILFPSTTSRDKNNVNPQGTSKEWTALSIG